MASLIVRNIDDALKDKLRQRAARHGRSMEDEVRTILRATLTEEPQTGLEFYNAIRKHFEGLGDIEIELPPREMGREPPSFD